MTLTVRDAKLTDKAPDLVNQKRQILFSKGFSFDIKRGVIVNKLLNDYAELLEQLGRKVS